MYGNGAKITIRPSPKKCVVSETSALRNIVGIATCGHSVAVDSNGFVYEWQNWSGINSNIYMVTDPNGANLSNIKAVSAGNGCSMALSNNGRVWKWTVGGWAQRVPAGDMQTTSG